jgi:L-cysteine/cystine lyase
VTFEEVRASFPVLERQTYLNAGTFGPLSRTTIEAVRARWQLDLDQGRSGSAYMEETRALRETVRGLLAAALRVPPEHVALTQSTTDGCQIVVGGLRLGPHDEIVTTEHEHFGLLGPLHASGARVVIASPTRESIVAAVGRHTRLLALSHVLWTTGNVLPIAELKAETGLPILVDGAQSVGAIPVDAAPFDFYTVSGQKWLCGPDTTGALYVADPEALDVCRPSMFSQTSFTEDGTFVPKEGAARFDSGWIPPASLVGLQAALDAGPDWRYGRTRVIAERCREQLAERVDVVTEPGQAGLVSFRSDGDPEEVVQQLAGRGVVVRAIPDTELVRASCGYWTSDEDVERLLEAL